MSDFEEKSLIGNILNDEMESSSPKLIKIPLMNPSDIGNNVMKGNDLYFFRIFNRRKQVSTHPILKWLKFLWIIFQIKLVEVL
jgi:hypothetical protein